MRTLMLFAAIVATQPAIAAGPDFGDPVPVSSGHVTARPTWHHALHDAVVADRPAALLDYLAAMPPQKDLEAAHGEQQGGRLWYHLHAFASANWRLGSTLGGLDIEPNYAWLYSLQSWANEVRINHNLPPRDVVYNLPRPRRGGDLPGSPPRVIAATVSCPNCGEHDCGQETRRMANYVDIVLRQGARIENEALRDAWAGSWTDAGVDDNGFLMYIGSPLTDFTYLVWVEPVYGESIGIPSSWTLGLDFPLDFRTNMHSYWIKIKHPDGTWDSYQFLVSQPGPNAVSGRGFPYPECHPGYVANLGRPCSRCGPRPPCGPGVPRDEP